MAKPTRRQLAAARRGAAKKAPATTAVQGRAGARRAPIPTRPFNDPGRPLRVRATRPGYYSLKRIRIGNVFTLARESHFSPKWMEWIDPETPERITTSQDEITRQHDEELGRRFSREGPSSGIMADERPTGDEEVLLSR